MISKPDLPGSARPRGRRAATLLAAAVPLAATVLATAPAAVAFAAPAPRPAAHAGAMLAGSDCVAGLGADQAPPKYPACLGD